MVKKIQLLGEITIYWYDFQGINWSGWAIEKRTTFVPRAGFWTSMAIAGKYYFIDLVFNYLYT